MNKIRTFVKGGVHPEKNKFSDHSPIVEMPLPEMVTIPMTQHLGAPATPIVKKGDRLKTGQLIATAQGFVSANIHAPVSGTVMKIEAALTVNGYKSEAVIVKVEADEWETTIDRSAAFISETALTPAEIVERVKAAGIVGMGGATFPTSIKLKAPEGKTIDTILINGAECEPYITADHRLMVEHAAEILTGTSLIMKALGVNKAFIGIETNKADAMAILREQAQGHTGIQVVPLKVKYPQGAEKMLVQATTGRTIRSGQLPLDVGCVVQNVGTAFAVYEAVMKNKPLIERIVTVTGKSVKEPRNVRVRLGTSIQELLDFAGGLPEDSGKIISGGTMMGKALFSADTPVMKGTSAIVVMQQQESKRMDQVTCIRCGKCVMTCPMGLEPYLLAVLTENEQYDALTKEGITDCMECGCCQYSCPAGRYLLDYIRIGKKRTIESLKKNL